MPELSLKEFRIPDRLPEMSRDDIARAIGDATRDIDLSRFDPRNLDLPDVSEIARELSKVDVPAALATVDTSGRSMRPLRAPFVIGGMIVLAVVAMAIAASPAVRPKLEVAASRAREEFERRRDALSDPAADPEPVEGAIEA